MRPEFPVEYDIDANDRFARVNTGWSVEARTSCDERLSDDRVLGQSLWDLVQDRTSREIYERLLQRVRENRVKVDFAFRCDTAVERRLLRMRIEGGEQRSVHFQVRLLQQQLREPLELLRIGRPTSNRSIPVCSWCKRSPIPAGYWVEVEEALQTLGLFDSDPLPSLDHVICPECRKVITESLLNEDRPPTPVILGSMPAA